MESGHAFGHYTIESLLGEGGMGRVYRARDTRLDRHVAIKVVAVDSADEASRSELRARLLREARAAAKVDHPNAVVIHDVDELDGTPFIVMELVSGRSLRSAVGDASVSVEDRVRWLREVALALGRAHELGIVHRDVKPENVMIADDGRVKVLDFGIARQLPGAVDPHGLTQSPGLGTLTVEGTVVGTVRYMSPEQIRGLHLDGRSDQFSWGVMAYELLSGQSPFVGADALGYGASILADVPAPLGGVPEPVAEAVRRALEKKPEARFSDMAELVAALDGRSVAPAAEPPKRDSAPAKRTDDLRQYTTAQVSQILKRAVDLQYQQRTGLGFESLVEIAREVGVDRAAVDAAARELVSYEPARRVRARQVRRFNRHLVTWGVFSVFFLALNLLTSSYWWFVWPVLGWGLGVAMHAVKLFMPGDPDRELVDPEVAKGVEVLMHESSRRLRIADAKRVRVEAEDPSEEAVAEQAALEEAALDRRSLKRARRAARREQKRR